MCAFLDSKFKQKRTQKEVVFVRFLSILKIQFSFYYYLGVSGATKDLKNVFFTSFPVDKAFQNIFSIHIRDEFELLRKM